MKNRIIAIILTALVLLTLSACGANKATDGNVSGGNVTDGNIAESTSAAEEGFFSAFTATALDGKEYTEELFESGKVTMVNIWATYCGPCVNEMPHLEAISKIYADKGLSVVGIIGDSFDPFNKTLSETEVEKAKEIVAQTGVTYTNLTLSAELYETISNIIGAYPTTIFLDENGNIIASFIGSRSFEQWSAIVDSVLAA